MNKESSAILTLALTWCYWCMHIEQKYSKIKNSVNLKSESIERDGNGPNWYENLYHI